MSPYILSFFIINLFEKFLKIFLMCLIAVSSGFSVVAMFDDGRFALQKQALRAEIARDEKVLSEINQETGKQIKAGWWASEEPDPGVEISDALSDIFCFKLFIAANLLSVDKCSAEEELSDCYREYYLKKIADNKIALQKILIIEHNDRLSERAQEAISSLESIHETLPADAMLKISNFVAYLAKSSNINYGDELTKNHVDCSLQKNDARLIDFIRNIFKYFINNKIKYVEQLASKMNMNLFDIETPKLLSAELHYWEREMATMQGVSKSSECYDAP